MAFRGEVFEVVMGGDYNALPLTHNDCLMIFLVEKEGEPLDRVYVCGSNK